MLSLCGLSRVRFGSCRKQTGCLDIYMGSIQWFLQLLIFYLFCLYFLVAFDISSSAIWGDRTADCPFCALLYRTCWRPFHPLWNDGAFFTFSLASKRLCSLVLFPGASKDCPSLFSLFLAAVWFWASLVILWLPLAEFAFWGLCWQAQFSRGETMVPTGNTSVPLYTC